VWRVLTCPAAAARWLPDHQSWIDAPPEAFSIGAALRFRSRMHRMPVVGELRVLELTPGRVRTHVRLGLFAFEARFTVAPEPGIDGATRIGLVLTLASRIAVVSGSLDRFGVRKLGSEIAEQTLSALATFAEEWESAARRS
jgi:hypothetical protein